MSAALRSVGLLDVLHEYDCGALGRAPCIHASSRSLATRPVEISRLAWAPQRVERAELALRRGVGQRGSALLLLIGATAALGTLALALLTASMISYEIVASRHDGAQARLLAESALELVESEIASGRLTVPMTGGAVAWSGDLPIPPPGIAALSEECGFGARLSTVAGPTGVQRLRSAAFEGVLFDVVAEGWCGRGFHAREARFAVADDLRIERLY